MEVQASATPAAEHVTINESGTIVLSPEAMAAMENVQAPDPVADNTAADQNTPPQVDIPSPLATRTIKHNGQEVEVPLDQELALIQKGYNYETKMAQLEAERVKLQSYNGLVSAIEASPEIRQKVSQALGYETQPQPPTAPQFDDPIEQLKWEVRQDVLKEVKSQFIDPIHQQTAQSQHQIQINNLKQQVQADPQFPQIQAAIIDQIRSLPESVGKDLYQRLDQDPRAYVDMFNTIKSRIGTLTPNQSPAAEATPQPTKREVKAPILESGNNAPDTAAQVKVTERIKELERKSRNGDFRATGELMSMLA